ncbi:hypothetical protein [Clostridium taeniosporum]|uniref:Uncharacterized protein n=1 Tax=Clostridium taeniosporum TaxID=394958 RepID=A0A1D7XNT6_9CLOT|nr:hypothetical protein [Clostridium taeniosporum]AOR25003.1 hypothetical protein BGI42_14750 [Clostridium taeniosporum]
MENKSLLSNIGNKIGIISISIPIILLALILNWFFQITPYQKLEGLPLMITPFICPIAIIIGIISIKISPKKLWKWGIILNIILFFAPYIYWHLGTLFFGV